MVINLLLITLSFGLFNGIMTATKPICKFTLTNCKTETPDACTKIDMKDVFKTCNVKVGSNSEYFDLGGGEENTCKDECLNENLNLEEGDSYYCCETDGCNDYENIGSMISCSQTYNYCKVDGQQYNQLYTSCIAQKSDDGTWIYSAEKTKKCSTVCDAIEKNDLNNYFCCEGNKCNADAATSTESMIDCTKIPTTTIKPTRAPTTDRSDKITLAMSLKVSVPLVVAVFFRSLVVD